ncbi:unnamed protein product [Trichobilharzia szidati]|nr:unnamed protein product [Trichobilharzia szidati]
MEPPRESFTLVAKDTQEVNQLLLILRQLLASNEEKLMKSQIDCNLDSDCDDPSDNNNNFDGIGIDVNDSGDTNKKDDDDDNDNDDSVSEPAAKKKRVSSDCDDNDNTQKQTMRLRNAVESLKRLIKNLEDLCKSLVDKESERVDAQRLARLRLRKDVEHWKEVEARKSKKSAHNYNQDSSYTPVQESRSSLLSSLHQVDTSKDRAERHLRRERRRQAQDSSDNDNEDSGGDGGDGDDDNNNETGSDEDRTTSDKQIERKESANNVAVVKRSNTATTNNSNSPFTSKSTHLTTHNTSTSPQYNSTRSSSSRRSIDKNTNNNNNASYQAFANRISASGTPKIPISRFSPEDTLSTVVVRRSALLEPRKTVSILPKSPISYSSSKLNSPTTPTYNGNSSNSSCSSSSISGVFGRRPTDSFTNSPFRTNTISRNQPSILRPCLPKSPPVNQNYHHVNGLSSTLTNSPLLKYNNNSSTGSMTPLKPTSPPFHHRHQHHRHQVFLGVIILIVIRLVLNRQFVKFIVFVTPCLQKMQNL